MNPRNPRRAALAFVAVTIFLDYAAQSISFPILPRLAQQLLGGDAASAARWTGFLEVGWAIPQFLAAPLLGMLSDRFGRRPVILISVFGVGAELVMGALAPTVGWLMAARILCGLTCGAQAAAMAYVADVTPPEDRTRAYGWMSAAMWSAIILGPALGGLLAAHDLRTPFWVAAGFAGLGGIYGLFVLPESLPRAKRAPLRWAKANPWGAVDLLVQRKGLLILGAALLLIWLAFQAKDNLLVLYTAHRYGWSPLDFGVFCSALAVASIAVQTGLTGRIAKALGDRRTVLLGLALEVAGFAGVGLAPTGPWFWIAHLPVVLGSMATPALQSLMSARVGEDEQGRLQGAMGSIASLTSITAPIAVTQVFAATLTWGPAWSGLTILVGGVLSLIAWILVLVFARPVPSGTKTP
ncbi:MFS transporter [Phenylobacterium sp.]|uniref:MFS transporter n=1 Tax=Phenylobacterium sp. TaxID=1871053 RepID=UPI003BAB36B6